MKLHRTNYDVTDKCNNVSFESHDHIHISTMFSGSWGNYIELIMMLQIKTIMSVLKILTYIITSTFITYRLCLAVVISAVLKVSTYIINSITYRLCFSISWRSLTSQITIRQWVPVKLSLSRDCLSTLDCEPSVNL
jgi:hypothetical protein